MPSLAQRVAGFGRLCERLGEGATPPPMASYSAASRLVSSMRATASASAATSAASTVAVLVFLRTSLGSLRNTGELR